MEQCPVFASEVAWVAQARPSEPAFLFRPAVLQATAQHFQSAFPGLVSYAVKANPTDAVLDNLLTAGVTAFDVASPAEIEAVRCRAPGAALHYHNPVRSLSEIARAREAGVVSWSVDRPSELAKLRGLPLGSEIAVRLHLDVPGAAYDFGSKFGASPSQAVALLRAAVAEGFVPSITFHPGTQCNDPMPWQLYVRAAAQVARDAGVALHRLNVGGGFAVHRTGAPPELRPVFEGIARATSGAFDAPPALVCEPGRAMVADCMTLAVPVKGVSDRTAFLCDGIYGGLSEWRDLGPSDRVTVVTGDGQPRRGPLAPWTVFGPTCDSLDVLPRPVALPGGLSEGDVILFACMGAYAQALVTGFNGYGTRDVVTVQSGPSSSGQRPHMV